MKITYKPGTRVGHLIYLNDAVNPKNGQRMLNVKCDCGRIYLTYPSTFQKNDPKCYVCANREKAQKRVRRDLVGKEIGIWKVLRLKENINGCNYYECECQKCHSISLKDSSSILASKENGKCGKCTPNFNFEIVDNYAIGTLPSGHKFIIDAEDIERVSKHFWYKKAGQDYIVCNVAGHPKYRLHRFVMGLAPIQESETDYVVDHINRNPMDCRKSNLRIATQHQNCFNKRIRSNNTTGYVGVTQENKTYVAQVCFNGRSYVVGKSESPSECAAMYNYASQLLFDSFIGHRNSAKELNKKEKERIKKLLFPVLREASEITSAVVI